MNENDYYKTTDITLATTLYCYGLKLEAIDRTNFTRATFIFKRNSELDGLIQAFWSHSLKVDPLLFFNELKQIKTRLYQEIN